MAAAGALDPTDTVIEIGPGTGRYLARIRDAVRPRRYVVFETAEDWRDWLVAEYGVEAPPTTGETLDGVDAAGLIHAHGVLVYTPFLVTAQYLAEIGRVATPFVVFDFCSTGEFDDEAIGLWLATADRYPVVLERGWVLSRLPDFDVVDEWAGRYGHGRSHYLILRRRVSRPS